ncbi:MBL fold metallo-hydrolase [Actinomadura logoneensis]|uniref:MBL fold metallo-hydrolase n=1 Tax=Actinomadura logoneensis TaxID=2293572 RepID=A0A372JD82_9ACTN|nr:MBL fold metallo-hydrolase [Actinomadura logoneensis]RFU37920.1 MBL fold metallo-hydrolase [Actinomadura logoneensis]
MTISITALGGPTAILELGGLRLLTDPAFDEPRDYVVGGGRKVTKTGPTALSPDEVGAIDAVLLSHEQHPDNLDESGRAFLSRVPLVLTNASSAARVAGATALGLWEHHGIARPDGGTLRVTRVPALHGPDGAEAVTGEVAGFVLAGDGLPTVYVSGDNASLDVVREVAERFPAIDVALLFAGAARTVLLDGALLTLDSAGAAEAARILDARHTVPLHFEGWAHFTEGADRLTKAFAEAGLTDRLVLLTPGESATL